MGEKKKKEGRMGSIIHKKHLPLNITLNLFFAGVGVFTILGFIIPLPFSFLFVSYLLLCKVF